MGFSKLQSGGLSVLLERHLQDRVLRLERADLSTQCINDCLRIYVHAGDSNIYNGGMAEEEGESGALGGPPATKKAIPSGTAPPSALLRVVNRIVHVGCRGCGKR